MVKHQLVQILFLATCTLSPLVHGHESVEEIVVVGRSQVLAGEARTASEGTIGKMDLSIRPLLRPGDLLESIPGLVVTQHSGSGKSNQMFLRGFNLDHGTDFATFVDGMPVNMRTHGHGQGYTDVNFLIPETVERIDFVKGPYHAELGDFSSAGGARIRTSDRFTDSRITLGIGEFGYRRLLALGSAELGGAAISAALEAQSYDGPWTDIEEDVKKISGLMKVTGGSDVSDWAVTAMHYDNEWNSADQIPERAVRQGLIGEFGSIDTSLGGATRRSSLSAQFTHEHEHHRSEWLAYAVDYKLDLWSNFTYFLEDPQFGDQFQQVDDRAVYGGSYNRYWVNGENEHFHHRLGGEFRYDDIGSVGLFRTRARVPIGVVRQDRVNQGSLGLFYELEWRLPQNLRAVLGVRADSYWFDVDADREDNGGDEIDSILSPKASLIYALSDTNELYFSGGYGFHSNDARGVPITRDPVTGEAVGGVDPLVSSIGFELGAKALIWERWNTSLAIWSLELDSELLFVGDAGTTEASRPSERWGIEFNNFWRVSDVWSAEADFAWTDARFSDNAPEGSEIPGALETVVTGAISAQYPQGWFGSFRVRYFSEAPLVEDGSVESDGSLMSNVALGWKNDAWRLQLDLLNVFDSDDHDIDYFYASRLPEETTQGIEDIHFHVFEPRQFRLYVSRVF